MQLLRKLLLSVALFCVPPLAQASLIFNFSFDNTLGSVPGPITGQIGGLQNGSQLPASELIITGIGSHGKFGHGLPFDVIAGGWQVFVNSFTVSLAGAITSWSFHASHSDLNGVIDSEDLDITSNGPGGAPFSIFSVKPTGQQFGITAAEGIQITRLGEVPSPSTLFLLGLGLLTLFSLSRRAART